jgi:hypothetical protein
MRRNINQQTHEDGRSIVDSSNGHAEGSGNHTEEAQRGPTPKQPNSGDPNSESRSNTQTPWSKEEMRVVLKCFLASGNYREANELWRKGHLNTRPNINAK